ncbi:hypothetical protein TNCV_2603181 [Trichonephila clavipes]|nr:hypothetical protein TNCV_2603181 [Trichonephila clavipes]
MSSMVSILAGKASSLIAKIAFSADIVFSRLQRLSFLFRKKWFMSKALRVSFAQSRHSRSSTATEFDWPRIITSTIARLRTELLKGMKIHPDKTRSYVQCKHCPDLQLTPNHILECPTVATKLLKMGMVPLRDSLRELLYSPDAPRIAEAVIKTFDGI